MAAAAGKAGREWLGWRCGCCHSTGGARERDRGSEKELEAEGLGAGVEAGGREVDRCGVGAAGHGELGGVGAGGDEMEAERKKSSGRSSHGEAAAAARMGFVVSPGSAIGE
jgi:hypothetical protein